MQELYGCCSGKSGVILGLYSMLTCCDDPPQAPDELPVIPRVEQV
jgi:hypothetical protein